LKSPAQWSIIAFGVISSTKLLITKRKMVFALYLRSLEIQGFKSFPEKTRIAFDKPITAIVGPNGSGKSNIADAILWVMGEQSTKTLRGGKMEDVIFGGTQRRPQLGFAEVSLILDNSNRFLNLDNSEVMITRRYYRSGESEYYVNRTLARLKDLSELLMDTGLGREGYSIIGQGRISEILSTKSKDRREIFEEAAGISRYRHRKEEAERKLQQTDENLVRIGDIISELDLQKAPLLEQAETAKKYLLLRDELRGIEISVWLRELSSLRTRADKADADYAAAKRDFDSATLAVEAGFEDIESLAEDMRKLDIEADSSRELISSAETRHSDTESAIAVLKSQLEGNSIQIERLRQELKSQDTRQDGVDAQINERKTRIHVIEGEKTVLDERMYSLMCELDSIKDSVGEQSEELGKMLASEGNGQNGLGEGKSELSALASQAQELYDMDNSVKLELATASGKLGDMKTEYKESIDKLSKAKQEAISLTNIVDGLALKAQNRLNKTIMHGDKLDKMSFDLKTLESRQKLLSEMEKDYQGYSKAVKFVMQDSSRGSLKNIHGTVAGQLKAGDRYTAAIETALGGAMQHIIVDTEEDGKAAINLLKRRDGGRATFLPLSVIKGGVLDSNEFAAEQGFEGIAYDLIEFESKYASVYANLLGRVLVADDLNNAVRMARNQKHRYKIVTLDGQTINAGGSMTGGSAASNAGILSRANELEQLAGRIDSHRADIKKAEREYAQCVREKSAAEYELETARSELRVAEEQVIKLEVEETHRAQLIVAANDAISVYDSELKSIENRIQQNNVATEDARTRISLLEAELELLKGKIDTAMRGQELLSQKRENVNSSLSELRAQYASLEAENAALEKAVSELSALRDEMYGSRDRQIETIENLESQNGKIRAEILDNQRVLSSVFNEIDSRKRTLSELCDDKIKLEAKRSSLNKSLQGKNNDLLNLERECSRLEQKKLAAQMEEKQILDKLWDTYELSRSAALDAGARIESVAEAQRRITSIKQQISELGNPNIGAIDEFERVNTRYLFMTSQRDDVEKAKGEILSIISELTARMRDIFAREFESINESFEKTFKELFGGGRACLVLEDPDDVLECGIEINVQPPGKSLKTITLLSGGEKAFVAIAIYFAILTVRPPPFVVMDEIDAALDDANVLRFTEHLRRMSAITQMIVISHQRGTMEEADVLYGVTMQELGVSSMLKIDLDEAEKHMKSIDVHN